MQNHFSTVFHPSPASFLSRSLSLSLSLSLSRFDQGPSFGANDPVANYGQPCATSAEVAYDLDVLPKMLELLRTGPPVTNSTWDSTPAHWTATSLYVGVGLQGAVAQTLLVSGLSVQAYATET